MSAAAAASPAQGDKDKPQVLLRLQASAPGSVPLVATWVAGLVIATFLFFSGDPQPATVAPLSARGLFVSGEFADATTDNIFALSATALDGMSRASVREHIERCTARIDAAIELLHPDAHRQLSDIALSPEQTEAGLRVIRRFGDARMVALSREAMEAIRVDAAGPLTRRLSERLAPKLGDLVRLHREMFPQRPIAFQANPAAAPGTWTPQAETGSAAKDRRLSAVDEITGGVNAHAQALFYTLEVELGDAMPKAPAQMLSDSGNSTAPMRGGGGHRLMDCLLQAAPNPSKVCACLALNTELVYTMMMEFAKGSI